MDSATHMILIVWATGLATYAWAWCFGKSANDVALMVGGDL